MDKQELISILNWHQSGKLPTDEAVDKICALDDVGGNEVALANCGHSHIVGRDGKCENCGKRCL